MGTLCVETVGKEATGVIGPGNTTYIVSKPYAPGTMFAVPNGRMVLPDGHSTPEVTETDPDAGIVDIAFELRVSDTLYFIFQDQLTTGPPLEGEFPSHVALVGEWPDHAALEGEFPRPGAFVGEWPDPLDELNGWLLSRPAPLIGELPCGIE